MEDEQAGVMYLNMRRAAGCWGIICRAAGVQAFQKPFALFMLLDGGRFCATVNLHEPICPIRPHLEDGGN